MRTQPALLLLGALLLAPRLPSAHAQNLGPTMRPLGSDAELLQYLAVLDRARPSRQAQVDRTCSDTTRLAPGGKRVVITGRISDTAGNAISNAQVYALGRCTTGSADGKYQLELPDGALMGRSRVRVTAAFIGYRRVVRDVAVRRRAASADFELTATPVRLEELSVEGMALGWEHLVEGSASIVFLRNEGRRFTRLGPLASSAEEPVADACKASCVDWYGNARPIFLRGRILALLGYELVEGAVEGGGVREVRRENFAPVGERTTMRD
jgi:hypothetical protein